MAAPWLWLGAAGPHSQLLACPYKVVHGCPHSHSVLHGLSSEVSSIISTVAYW